MKRKAYILLISIFILNLTSYGNCFVEEFLNDTSTAKIIRYIPEGYKISCLANGYLNNDSLLDYAVIIRNPDEMDSNLLLVLLQNRNKTFTKSLENNDVITTRYENTLEIRNNILHIETDEPWNGTNSDIIDLTFRNNDWLCLRTGSFCSDPDNNWENSFDFVTGVFTIKHILYGSNNQTYAREISGKAENVTPFSIVTDAISNHINIKYNGKEYWVTNRCNLWSGDETDTLIGK